ncbi:AEC family transporter [Agromyces seonyuensis]|uniref:AEC family transporter n=1 Tax=Agromyces seonyuensis TaxID=2662446 RepID=A0A6I4NZW3_9MICO|nr:AEC family transporter [Agromyces seonyuensis]MWB99858.1 AEC family transporter [Agromyces seonyuensis]
MLQIATGFVVIGLAVLVGWIVARTGILDASARLVLTRLSFTVLGPFLLFSVLSTADVGALFSTLLPVSALAAFTVMALFALVALLIWRRRFPETVIGMLSSGYVNGNNMGIPIATYMLGNAAYSAPVMLLQLLCIAPLALATLDATVNHRGRGVWPVLKGMLTNPIIVGSLAGVLVALSGIELPPIVMDPVELIGHASVPVILIAFGMSLQGQRILAPGTGRRRDVVLATVLNLVVMPLAAWAIGRFVFGLGGGELYAVTVLAALPTGQNVFVYAQQYRTGEVVARDTIFITTLGAVPVLILIALLLAPAA